MPEEEDFGLMVTPPSGQGKPRDVMADLRMVEEEGDDAPPSWDSGDLLVQPATPLDKSPESAATQRGIQKLATLATDLMSPKPIKRHRSVTFEQSCLPPECNVDNVVYATIYHNGQCLELEKTRKKPGQTGYQIFLIKPQGAGGVCETFSIAPDQPYKVVFTHGEGSSFGFTGAEDSKGSDSKGGDSDDEVASHVIGLAPIKKEQLMRIRMDILVADGPNNEKRLTALLISAGNKPSSTALMRFYGLSEQPRERPRTNTVKATVVLCLHLAAILLVMFCFRTPLEALYHRYHLSCDEHLISSAKDIVGKSKILTREFGAPIFDVLSVFAIGVDMYTSERASFTIPFRVDKVRKGSGVTTEWELEGTRGQGTDNDEISFTFEGELRYGEARVEAYKVDKTWHYSSMKLDIYRSRSNYAESLAEYMILWLSRTMSSESMSISIRDSQPHLRINVEIGHDEDRDGDADNAASIIIQEKPQLIHEKRVIGYIRPDDDHEEL